MSQAPYHHKISGKGSWVPIHPRDNLYGLHPSYLTNPETFIPEANRRTGRIETWGIDNLRDDKAENKDKLPRYLEREAKFATLYRLHETPESLFICQLITKKMRKLEMNRATHERNRCDYILEIKMPEIKDKTGSPYITRSIKVSGGIKLNIFQDRILQPVMGWARNYHGYLFTDHKDGAMFGPRDSNHVDMVNMYKKGHEYIPDDVFTIGDVLECRGSTLGYLYDLGDDWVHEIMVEAIFPLEESNGQFAFIDGTGACPAEDMGGGDWEETVELLEKDPVDRYLLRQIGGALNYRYARSTRVKDLDWTFDPYAFDLEEATARVREALRSCTSIPSGAKINVLLPDTTQGHFRESGDCRGNYPRKTRTIYLDNGPYGSVGHIMETVPVGGDPEERALCAKCGNPNDLDCCGACNSMWYCSRRCQQRDWASHKPFCISQGGKRPLFGDLDAIMAESSFNSSGLSSKTTESSRSKASSQDNEYFMDMKSLEEAFINPLMLN